MTLRMVPWNDSGSPWAAGYLEPAGVEEVLLDSVEDLAGLSLVDLVALSDFESPEELESDEDELSLEPFLFSAGALGRP